MGFLKKKGFFKNFLKPFWGFLKKNFPFGVFSNFFLKIFFWAKNFPKPPGFPRGHWGLAFPLGPRSRGERGPRGEKKFGVSEKNKKGFPAKKKVKRGPRENLIPGFPLLILAGGKSAPRGPPLAMGREGFCKNYVFDFFKKTGVIPFPQKPPPRGPPPGFGFFLAPRGIKKGPFLAPRPPHFGQFKI